jgi:flagellin-specific chaperone FliS
MEYAACFVSDSEGFFRRSLIEGCVVSENKPIILGDNTPILFDAMIAGNPNRQYVYGIDPASEQDNFSITILEVHNNHCRIVYCWTTNRSNFKNRQKTGLVKEHDFYGFCARKIRNLMKIFPCSRIGIDAQGGGISIEEALHDPSKLEESENLIWPVIDFDKTKDTDSQPGSHILEMVQFAKADWTAQANHGLRKDFEDKVLLFPRFDNITLGLALDKEGKDILESNLDPIYDTLSECILEIEELKNELTTIVMTQTSTGPNARDRWDTPEVKLPNGKKGR